MLNIDVELDDQGKFTFKLPQGTYRTQFEFMGSKPDLDVLSVNAPEAYALTLISAAEIQHYDLVGPVTSHSPVPAKTLVFAFQSDQGTFSQQQAMITVVTTSGAYSFGILINPASIPLSVRVDNGGLALDSGPPVGVTFNAMNATFNLLTAGNFVFDFWISPTQRRPLRLIPKPFRAIPPEIAFAVTETHAYVASYNMEIYKEPQSFYFDFMLGDPNGSPASRLWVIDPTIVNNPINQGPGSGGGDDDGFAVYACQPAPVGSESLALR